MFITFTFLDVTHFPYMFINISHGEIHQKWWNLKEQSMTRGLDLKTCKKYLNFYDRVKNRIGEPL